MARQKFDYQTAIKRTSNRIISRFEEIFPELDNAHEVIQAGLDRWQYLAVARFIPREQARSGSAFYILPFQRVGAGAFRTYAVFVSTPDRKLEIYKYRLKDRPQDFPLRLDALCDRLKKWQPSHGDLKSAVGLKVPAGLHREDEQKKYKGPGGIYYFQTFQKQIIQAHHYHNSVIKTGYRWIHQAIRKRGSFKGYKISSKGTSNQHVRRYMQDSVLSESMRELDRFGRHHGLSLFLDELEPFAVEACWRSRQIDLETYDWITEPESKRQQHFRASAIASYPIFAKTLTRSQGNQAGTAIDKGASVPLTIMEETEVPEQERYRPKVLSAFHGRKTTGLPEEMPKAMSWIIPFLNQQQGERVPQLKFEWQRMFDFQPRVLELSQNTGIPVAPRLREIWLASNLSVETFDSASEYIDEMRGNKKNNCFKDIRDYTNSIFTKLVLPRVYQLARQEGLEDYDFNELLKNDHDDKRQIMNTILDKFTVLQLLHANQQWHGLIVNFSALINGIGIPEKSNWPALTEAIQIDHVILEPITNSEDLAKAGKIMNHCAAIFAGECLINGTHVYNCRLLSTSGERTQATLAVKEDSSGWGKPKIELYGLAGYQNSEPHPKIVQAVEEFLQRIENDRFSNDYRQSKKMKFIKPNWDEVKEARQDILSDEMAARNAVVGFDPYNMTSCAEAFEIFKQYLHKSWKYMGYEEWVRETGLDDTIMAYLDKIKSEYKADQIPRAAVA